MPAVIQVLQTAASFGFPCTHKSILVSAFCVAIHYSMIHTK